MSGRPAKSLAAHVREGTFRARRETHRALLLGAELPWPGFALLQARYRAATSEPERRALALEFEQGVRLVREQARQAEATGGSSLENELASLGKAGTLAQLLPFFGHFLVHPKGPLLGQPFRLECWQRVFLREFFRRDRGGRRVYRSGLLGMPRGNGKTPFAAALGLYELVTRLDAPEIYLAAGSKEQAAIGLEFARPFVEQGPLADWITVKSSALICAERRGLMRVLSSDGRLQHGRAPTAAIVDELWAFETSREEQLYTALSSALHKRRDAYLLALTTAGYDRHSLLGRIYEAALGWPEVTVSPDGCLTIAKDIEHGQLLYWYGAPEAADLEDRLVWRAVNPASWIRLDDLGKQLHDPSLGEHEFRRLHLNQWTAAREAWLPAGCWASLRSDEQIPERAPIWVGVDVGLYHDSTAVCWAHQLGEGRIILRARIWSADPTTAAHVRVPGGKVRLDAVEQFIDQLAHDYQLREVVFDPRYFARSAELLEQQGLRMVEFLQSSAPMADAYQRFYQLALEGQLIHDGDPLFAAQIEATAADKTERGWRVRKLKSSAHIDATVAAVLAVARVHTADDDLPQIFWFDPNEPPP